MIEHQDQDNLFGLASIQHQNRTSHYQSTFRSGYCLARTKNLKLMFHLPTNIWKPAFIQIEHFLSNLFEYLVCLNRCFNKLCLSNQTSIKKVRIEYRNAVNTHVEDWFCDLNILVENLQGLFWMSWYFTAVVLKEFQDSFHYDSLHLHDERFLYRLSISVWVSTAKRTIHSFFTSLISYLIINLYI